MDARHAVAVACGSQPQVVQRCLDRLLGFSPKVLALHRVNFSGSRAALDMCSLGLEA